MNIKKILIVFFIAFAGGLAALSIHQYFKKESHHSISEIQQAYATSGLAVNSIPDINFVEVAGKSVHTVVHIKTTFGNKTAEKQKDIDPNNFDPFDFFREHPMPYGPSQASGSGVILTPDGYIATNNHVVENASKVEVILNDKRSYIAEIIGTDPETDLALLKIEESELPFLVFGNSDNIKVGEWVIAVGNPMNLTSTVTAGIISAKGRNINLLRQNSEYAIENFIQTDAAVNPGNSGGALVNVSGELIGINTAIASQTGSYTGYSFAIPVNIVKKILDDLKKYGEVKRAILGVRIQDITAELAESENIKEMKGVFVPDVMDGSAADKGGIKKGDIILKINEVEVNSSSNLQEQISKYYPGEKIKVTINRKGSTKVLDITLLSKEGKSEISKTSVAESKASLGATFVNLTKEDKEKYKVSNGVKIKKLGKSPLKDKGIPEGFIITSINKKPVYTISDAKSILDDAKGSVLIDGVMPDGSKDAFAIRVD
ncbi:MAG: Do family serine endopeptidase [Flavobacteriales bacterium]|nr:Do family serine endopeptidase [Flavobacteriales bacterium]